MDITTLISEAVAEALGSVGTALGGYVLTSDFEDRQTRTMEQGRWAFQALNFFAFDGDTRGDHPVWSATGLSHPNGLFDLQKQKADDGVLMDTENWENVYRAFRDHMNEWPDSDI